MISKIERDMLAEVKDRSNNLSRHLNSLNFDNHIIIYKNHRIVYA